MSAFGGGGGLFGSSNAQTQMSQPAQQPGQSGGLFGGLSSASNTNAGAGTSPFGNPQSTGGNTGGGGLFGNTNMAGGSGTGGGLFGSTAGSSGQQPASGGLFGSSTTSTQPASGGLFGNTTQQPATGGLFGNANTNQANQPATGGLFGSTTQTGQQQFASGGLFGSTTATQPSTGGGLFGNPSTSTTGGGLFGNANTSSMGNTGGGLFGSNTNPSMSGTTGGSFGNTNPSINTGGGLFGSSTQPSTTSISNQPSLFGQTQPQQPQGSLFGSTTQTQPQSGLLGGSLFGGQKTAVPAQQQADAQAQFAQILQRIEAVMAAWNPNSPNNRFQHYFYNLVEPSQVGLYGRPQNATNEALWQRAVRENPDPGCMVPVVATSFDDLQKRVDAQGQQASAHQEKLTEIRSRIEKLGDTHNLKNVARLRQASAVQAQLTHRLLSMVQHLHLLIPALRSSSIRPEEEVLRVALEEIESEIRRPGGMGRLVGKLNELWALVGALNAMKSANAAGRTEWTVVDEDGLNQLVQILSEQQAGLAHVTKILRKGLRDTAVIYGEEPKAEETNGRSDLLQSFSQTMRASTIR